MVTVPEGALVTDFESALPYKAARKRHPRRWSRSTRCWRQQELVWSNPPPPGMDARPTTLATAA